MVVHEGWGVEKNIEADNIFCSIMYGSFIYLMIIPLYMKREKSK